MRYFDASAMHAAALLCDAMCRLASATSSSSPIMSNANNVVERNESPVMHFHHNNAEEEERISPLLYANSINPPDDDSRTAFDSGSFLPRFPKYRHRVQLLS